VTSNPLYVRVRSVAEDGQRSTWSAWILATPGQVTSGTAELTFDTTTPTTSTLLTIPAGATIRQVSLDVISAFDGVIDIRVGDAASTARFFYSPSDALTGLSSTYTVFPLHTYATETDVLVTIYNTSATTGSGKIILLH
jgi:hypothetical protein